MNDNGSSQVLGYLDYQNKLRTAAWEERLWQQHLNGAPADFRAEPDRQRYCDLLGRVEASRTLAQKLYTRRTAHAPQFSALVATAG